MERPPSQVENARPSGLKQPSRLPALASGRTTLQETTSSDVNVRAGNGVGSMGPPGSYANGLNKHKLNNPPEPPTKRKTLVDRAGEAPSSSRTGIPNKPSFSSSTAGFGVRPTSIYQQSNRTNGNVASASSIGGMRPSSSKQANAFRQTAPTSNRPPSAANIPLPEYDQESDGELGVSGNRKVWDVNGRLGDMESRWEQLQAQMQIAADTKSATEERIALYKSQVEELREENRLLATEKKTITTDLERARNELHTTSTDLRQARRDQEREVHDLERKHERELAELEMKREKEQQRTEISREKDANRFAKEMEEARKAWREQHDTEMMELRDLHWQEQEEMRETHDKALTKLQKEIDALQQAGQSRASESATEVQNMRDTIESLKTQLDASNSTTTSLRKLIATHEARMAMLEQERDDLIKKTHFLEGTQEAQSSEFSNMQEELQSAVAQRDATLETLRKEEMLRRKLNAMILELRGNIRVFVRTRPLLNGEDDPANVEYVDEDSLDGCKEMVVHANPEKTATGKQRNEKHAYSFDRVFTPGSSNSSVFDECQDLIQSVVDGYNVSILSYGQTGSGKTYGMSGPSGIIPSSIKLLLTEMQRLKEKGWEYAVEASFVEVYNETLNDLLGDAKKWVEDDNLGVSTRGKKKEKHEIHHDANTGRTTVTNLTTQRLWPPPTDEGSWPPPAPVEGGEDVTTMPPETYTERAVANLLETAAKNRRVAATKANERSSRSHSIFMLTLKGSCAATGESSEGVLNLVDLAGSERLKQSGAEGSRMKETQAINKSLSSLGDVIAALGNKGGNSEAHVPYRNSKLTYLLQSSLGGTTAGKSSRTLMLLHLSPLQTHWQESRSSLLFGSKVHGTHIGTAKKR